jgi:hypothetical protein
VVSFISRYIRSVSEGREHTTMAVVVLILDRDVEVMVMHRSQLVFFGRRGSKLMSETDNCS